jgi:hypothetical protein
MHALEDFENNFEHENILPAWIHFFDFHPAYELCLNNALDRGINAVLSGAPILDEYEKELDTKPFKKITNGRKTVVYAPHWSIGSWNNTSSFHLYFDLFAKLLIKHPNVNFVFKPHPMLRREVNTRNNTECMSSFADFDDYCEKWNNASNGLVITDSSFINLFKVSELLITDSYSFIASWLPTGKPCLLPFNPQTGVDYLTYFYDFAHPVIDSYYIAGAADEIEKVFIDTILNEVDPKADKRKEAKERLLYNYGCAGQFIADYVEKQLGMNI